MEIHFYILYALAGISIALGVALLLKIKTAIYLLEQPIVKKMSPQLNLKPVKVDPIDGNAPRNGTPMSRPAGRDDRPPREERAPGGRDGRGEDRGGRDRDRGPREDRGDRPPRAEGDRGPRPEGDRGPRGDRGDRFGGRDGGRDRDRGPRGDRGDRGDRPPRREFSGEREAAPSESRPAPTGDSSSPAPLAPRRPLPSTVDAEGNAKPHSAPEAAPVNEAGAADPFFGRDDSDIQHGRRNQLKKKPKFEDSAVEEKPAEETKAL